MCGKYDKRSLTASDVTVLPAHCGAHVVVVVVVAYLCLWSDGVHTTCRHGRCRRCHGGV